MENLGELFAALAAARAEFAAFAKSKTANIKSDKGSYQYNYADLSDIIDATALALAKHGLVIIQEPEVITEGGRSLVVISGCIAHKSGGVYALRPLPLPVVGNTAQAIGSAISYARRYQLSAILNLAASDDDGQAAQDTQVKVQAKKPLPDATADEVFENKRERASKEQLAELEALGKQFYGEEWKEQRPKLAQAVSKGSTNDIAELLPTEAVKLVEGIKRKMALVNAEVGQ